MHVRATKVVDFWAVGAARAKDGRAPERRTCGCESRRRGLVSRSTSTDRQSRLLSQALPSWHPGVIRVLQARFAAAGTCSGSDDRRRANVKPEPSKGTRFAEAPVEWQHRRLTASVQPTSPGHAGVVRSRSSYESDGGGVAPRPARRTDRSAGVSSELGRRRETQRGPRLVRVWGDVRPSRAAASADVVCSRGGGPNSAESVGGGDREGDRPAAGTTSSNNRHQRTISLAGEFGRIVSGVSRRFSEAAAQDGLEVRRGVPS